MKKTCIVITGPTAVGKTALAISLAQHFSTQIISADSRQCYKELSIGVAKPSTEELQSITHHFIDSHSIHENVNAGIFEKYALNKIAEIFASNDIAIMVGGTGLYVKTFCEGLDEIPMVLPGVREQITSDYNANGLVWLQQEVELIDPIYCIKGEMQNPQRLMRALEVKLSTGKSIVEFQSQQKIIRDFNIIKIGLELPREDLYKRINLRVDKMLEDGLLDEVKDLVNFHQLNALQTVGYKELFDYLDNKTSFVTAVEAIKINTRHYAKRQLTWFKKDETIEWCAPELAQAQKIIMQAM